MVIFLVRKPFDTWEICLSISEKTLVSIFILRLHYMQDTFLLGCVPVSVRHNTSSHVIHFIGHLWSCLPCLQVSALFTLKSMHNFLGFLGKTYAISKQISDTHDDCTICIITSIHRCILLPKIWSIMLYKCFFRI